MTAQNDYTIAGLRVGLRALTHVLERDVTTTGELAVALNIARSRAHRILRTLEIEGYAAPSSTGRGFVPAARMLRLSSPPASTPDRSHLNKQLDRIGAETGEDIHSGILMGDHFLVTDGVSAERLPKIGLRRGMLAPAHAMAGGKLLLSYLDPGQVLGLLPTQLSHEGPNTITDRAQLVANLKEIRRDQLATAIGESEHGVDSVAVLLSGSTWRNRTALIVSCPSHRGGEHRLRSLGKIARHILSSTVEHT